MSDKLYELMDWPEIEAVVYSEESEPRRILVNMEAADMPSERFLQNVPGMNSMIKNVSLQLQKNVDLRGKLKNIWKNSR